jgi:isoprenylcysteine carboxyl methyltransferase family protein
MHQMTEEDEVRLVDAMIDVYAEASTHNPQAHSEVIDAAALKAYTQARIAQCRYRSQHKKPFCNVCPVHCYKPEMRRQIRAVMRYSGPRMLLRHPLLCLQHLIGTIRSKKRSKKELSSMNQNHPDHLPVMGIGPVCIAVMVACTVAGILPVTFGGWQGGTMRSAALSLFVMIAGMVCITGGVVLWCAAVFGSRIDSKIKANQLVTDGVYALVRNPIYAAFLFICTGALLLCRNWYVLLLPPLFWLYLTVFMKLTEEQWLAERFGDEYTAYTKRVNRFIPWKRR